MANDEHKQIKIQEGDTVIISATPIPGNERLIANTINALFLRGADVIYGREAGVHVSGHGCREEQKLMINLCKPKCFMPIHGEYRMLVGHAQLAVDCGVAPENTFVMENGDVLELFKDRGQKAGRIKSGIVLIDSNREWKIDEEIITDRRHMAEDGLVVIALSLNGKREVIAGPDVSLKGLILPKGVPAEEFVIKVQEELKAIFDDRKTIGSLQDGDIRSYIQGRLNGYFTQNMKSSPFVQIVLQMVPAQQLSRERIEFSPPAHDSTDR